MDGLKRVTSPAMPLPRDNIDTDIIYPARFLLITDRDGLGHYAFHDWRFDADGQEKPDFPMNRSPWKGASILFSGENFGCGSSREHAPWALADMGIRCVIARSFGEIFHANCFRSGIAPIALDDGDHARVLAAAEAGETIVVDIVCSEIAVPGSPVIAFAMDESRREDLIEGRDAIETVLVQFGEAIDSFENVQRNVQP